MGQGVSQLVDDDKDHGDDNEIPASDSRLHDRKRDEEKISSPVTDGQSKSSTIEEPSPKHGNHSTTTFSNEKEPRAPQEASPTNSATTTTPRRMKKRQSDYQSLCRMKKARNEARLKELGFAGGSVLRSNGITNQDPSDHTASAKSPTDDIPKGETTETHVVPRSFPHRQKEIRQLNSLLSRHEAIVPSPIFIHGPKGAGKSSIVSQIVETHCENAAYLDCGSFLFPSKTSQINSAILQAIYDHFATYRATRTITSPWKLYLELQEEPFDASSSRRTVVLDHADCLTIDLLRQLFCLPDFIWIVVTPSSLMPLSGTLGQHLGGLLA